MKKTLFRMTVLMVISLFVFVSCNLFDSPEEKKSDESGFTTEIASFNGVTYPSFQAAVDAALAQGGGTVTLLCDVKGSGISVNRNNLKKDLVLDFAGHSYTLQTVEIGTKSYSDGGFYFYNKGGTGDTLIIKNAVIIGGDSFEYPLVSVSEAEVIISDSTIKPLEKSVALEAINDCKVKIEKCDVSGIVEVRGSSAVTFSKDGNEPEGVTFDVGFGTAKKTSGSDFIISYSTEFTQGFFSDRTKKLQINTKDTLVVFSHTYPSGTSETDIKGVITSYTDVLFFTSVTDITYNGVNYTSSTELAKVLPEDVFNMVKTQAIPGSITFDLKWNGSVFPIETRLEFLPGK